MKWILNKCDVSVSTGFICAERQVPKAANTKLWSVTYGLLDICDVSEEPYLQGSKFT